MNDRNKSRKNAAIAQIEIVQEILRRWDPMELAPGEFAPQDEYDSYAPHIVSLVVKNCSLAELLDHLRTLRSGMASMRDNVEHDIAIANEIINTLRNDEV